MEKESDLAKGLHSLLLLRMKAKGTSYLEELRRLREQLAERAENKKIMDKDESGDKDILNVKTENRSEQANNESQNPQLQKPNQSEEARKFLRIKKKVEEQKNRPEKKKASYLEEWAKNNIKFFDEDGSVSTGILERDKKHLKRSCFSIVDIIGLLIEAAESQALAEDLINTCWKLNMSRSGYINFDNDPLYSNGSNFVFDCNNDEIGRLEIIDVKGQLLQSGFQIIYKPKLFSRKTRNDFLHLRRFLKEYYKNEFMQLIQNTKVYNFANKLSQCYLSKSLANGRWILNFRIMNKENWRLATLGIYRPMPPLFDV